MPTYEYECPGDGEAVELQLPIDHERPNCKVCGAPLNRIYSAPVIQFKGDGFYSTGG